MFVKIKTENKCRYLVNADAVEFADAYNDGKICLYLRCGIKIFTEGTLDEMKAKLNGDLLIHVEEPSIGSAHHTWTDNSAVPCP